MLLLLFGTLSLSLLSADGFTEESNDYGRDHQVKPSLHDLTVDRCDSGLLVGKRRLLA
jgi:hypothetical protein